MECVACGEHYSGRDHKCRIDKELRIEASRKSVPDIAEKQYTYSGRLSAGFWMWKQSELI